jgi:CHAD domain-containing protein
VKARKVEGLDPAAPLADNLERIVRVRLDELCGFVPKVFDPEEVLALHDMRIAAKRLRYILEVGAEPCFGRYAVKAGKRTKELQDLLGEIHDCDVTRPRVLAMIDGLRAADAREAVARAGDAEDLDPEHVAGTGHATAWRGLETLAVYLAARRALLFERFLARWKALEREGFRPRLEYAIGERPTAEPRFSRSLAAVPDRDDDSPADNGAAASGSLPSDAPQA